MNMFSLTRAVFVRSKDSKSLSIVWWRVCTQLQLKPRHPQKFIPTVFKAPNGNILIYLYLQQLGPASQN